MTTLGLAEKIAKAVLVYHLGEVTQPEQAAVHAVLRVLHENNTWFCRMDPAKAEDWPEEQEERYEMVQPELFK